MQLETSLRRQIVNLLDAHRIMTIATNRPDGWPQATIIGYANDGLIIHALIGRTSQKYANITRDSRISIAIGNDVPEPSGIAGLSMAARAEVVTNAKGIERIGTLLLQRYPEYRAFAPDVRAAADIVFLRIVPQVVSVLDYSKGFGHTELARISNDDLEPSQALIV